jgi:MFS family permease
MTSLYPQEKTARLNTLHAWWPGGLVIGGLLGVLLSNLGFSWQAKLALVAVPALAVVVLCIGVRFPLPSVRLPASRWAPCSASS